MTKLNMNTGHLPKLGLTRGFNAERPLTLLPLPPLVGVTDFEIGVVGFSSIFFADGVLALDEVPLLGLKYEIINYNSNYSGFKKTKKKIIFSL